MSSFPSSASLNEAPGDNSNSVQMNVFDQLLLVSCSKTNVKPTGDTENHIVDIYLTTKLPSSSWSYQLFVSM